MTYTTDRYEILKDAPFPNLDIPAPETLETTEDYAQLVQHLVSRYRGMLNAIYRQQGYMERTNNLETVIFFLSEVLPVNEPECVRNYPDSLNEIYTLVGGLIASGTEQKTR